jgi:hypothetical protein
LHANVAVPAGDRARLERLALYCARRPVAMERLERLADGRLLYRFKRAWRDGTTYIVLDPLGMLRKLSALIPAPHAHLVRYAGLFAPAAKWRSAIVPGMPQMPISRPFGELEFADEHGFEPAAIPFVSPAHGCKDHSLHFA